MLDILSLSTAQSLSNVQSDFSVAMLSKSLDTLQDYGDGLTKMMEASVQPNLGQNIDIKV